MRKLLSLLMILAILMTFGTALAEEPAPEAEKTYDIVWLDEAGLIPKEDRPLVEEAMRAASVNGHMVFLTVSEPHTGSAEAYAQNCLNSLYGYDQSENATVFLIDMTKRIVAVQSTGGMKRFLTTGVSDTIMDNVYEDARKQDYTACAVHTFEQIAAVAGGKEIPQPMRLTSTVLIALLAGTMFAFLLLSTNRGRQSKKSLKAVAVTVVTASTAALVGNVLLRKITHSSGSGSGGSGGGGGGGGGFSGGSHGF